MFSTFSPLFFSIAYNQMDADEFIIIDRFIQKGQICAAIYMERWHRAEIVGVFTRQQQVKVSHYIATIILNWI